MNKFNCPVCGQPTLTEERMFEICRVCGWEDDNVQFNDPDYCGGANSFSLNQYRALWKQGKIDIDRCDMSIIKSAQNLLCQHHKGDK